MTITIIAIALGAGLASGGLAAASAAAELPHHWSAATQIVRSDVDHGDVRDAEPDAHPAPHRVGCTPELIGSAPQCPLSFDGSTAGAWHFASL